MSEETPYIKAKLTSAKFEWAGKFPSVNMHFKTKKEN
jgi:hypothetical protein